LASPDFFSPNASASETFVETSSPLVGASKDVPVETPLIVPAPDPVIVSEPVPDPARVQESDPIAEDLGRNLNEYHFAVPEPPAPVSPATSDPSKRSPSKIWSTVKSMATSLFSPKGSASDVAPEDSASQVAPPVATSSKSSTIPRTLKKARPPLPSFSERTEPVRRSARSTAPPARLGYQALGAVSEQPKQAPKKK